MEGPSLIILREEVALAIGKKVLEVSGNSKIDQAALVGKKILGLKSWGKHFLICFKDFTIRIHFLMFGSYRINEVREDRTPMLRIKCKDIEMNFYSCAVKVLTENPDDLYDWSVDVLSDEWDAGKALKTIQKKKDSMICDVLMDQDIFSGVGNIIKNEVLFRVRMHPEKVIKDIPKKKLEKL